MDLGQIIAFSVVVMCAYFIEGLIGFGGTIMALPIASAIAGLKVTVPVMTIVVLIASIVIAVRDFKHINKKEFIKIILGEKDKVNKIKMVFKGYKDYKKGIRGKLKQRVVRRRRKYAWNSNCQLEW